MTKTQTCIKDLEALIRAGNSLLWVTTPEELRAERAIMDASAAALYQVKFWDCSTGLSGSDGGAINPRLQDPQAFVAMIRDTPDRAVYVARDLHKWLADPLLLRGLRSLARMLQAAPRAEKRAVVILTPSAEIPLELRACAAVVEFPLPEREEIASVLDQVVGNLPPALAAEAATVNGAREAAIDAALGLTADGAGNAFARSLVTKRRIDPAVVSIDKRRVIAGIPGVTWYDPDPRGLAGVAGLELLKSWLGPRKAAFGAAARAYGLPAPKGVLLVGVPGCGKSHTAKCLASAWGMPLLRLDLGAVKSKWVGESEANIRQALAVAETIAPCVVWLDEVEKAIGGAVGGAADGGVSADALGAVLSWMQERVGRVFVVATANNVEALPPELMRKGRFDELFFVDLPTASERAAVLSVTLAQYATGAAGVDVVQVASATRGFSGAELAALVPEAMYSAFGDGARPITTDDLLEAAARTVPLSATSAEKIKSLREWAKGRARPASAPEEVTASVGRTLDL